MAADETAPSSWTREQDRAFENALFEFPEDSLDRWEKIASRVQGKSVDEIRYHYELLVDDVFRIESGHVPLPCYDSSSSPTLAADDDDDDDDAPPTGKKTGESSKASKSEQERRKGIAWTEDEHRNFLLGLDKYGKGDWRSISRNFVVTRTPTQVASHAQKYFIRLNSMNKDRRRSSIHDITSVNNGDISVPQGPITGQTSGSSSSAAGGSSGKSSKQQPPQTMVTTSGVGNIGMYGGTTIGQPVVGPLVSAVGTPAHMAYGVRGPVPGQVVPGAPLNVVPMTYPMPHPSAHR